MNHQPTIDTVDTAIQFAVRFPDGQVTAVSPDIDTARIHLFAFALAALDHPEYEDAEIVTRTVTTLTSTWDYPTFDNSVNLVAA